MAVDNPLVPIEEAGNDVKVDYDFAFKIFAETDIVAYKKSAAGVYTLGVLNTDYTVAFDSDAETGTVTWVTAPVTGGGSAITRASAQTQATVFPRVAPAPAKNIENALDKLTLHVQELDERVDRSLLQPAVPFAPTAIEVEAPVASRIVAWNADADALVSTSKTLTTFQTDVDDTAAAAVAAAASAAAASSSASSASSSASAAASSASGASTSASSAASSAAAASASASSASSSASTATTQAATATAQASAASASAAAALASESAAAASAAAAATAKTNAETAETNAELAETNAETAQAAAEAALAATLAAGLTVSSGTFAARPAAPATTHVYTATDQDNTVFLYVVAAAKWITLG